MIILSVSSSNSSSISLISADTFTDVFICSMILSSLSRSLIAKNLFCSSGTTPVSLFSTAPIISSALSQNSWTGVTFLWLWAMETALFAASVIPVPFRAEIVTTSQPSFFFSLSICIVSPFFSTISIMLTAMMTGIPSSRICVVRYRLRSILVPSTILMIASGFS